MLAAAKMLFLLGRIAGSLLVGLECLEPYSWILPCRMLGGTGAMLGDMGVVTGRCLALDEPCSCSISSGRINSVCRIARDGWITCGDTVLGVA